MNAQFYENFICKLSTKLSRLLLVFGFSLLSIFSFSVTANAQTSSSMLDLSLSTSVVQESRPVDLTIKFRPGTLRPELVELQKNISVTAITSGESCNILGGNCVKIPVSNPSFKGESTTVSLLIPSGTYGTPGPNKLLLVNVTANRLGGGGMDSANITDINEDSFVRFETTPATPGTENNTITQTTTPENAATQAAISNSPEASSGMFGYVMDGIGKIITDAIIFLIGAINQAIFTFFQKLVAPLLQSVLSIRTYTDAFADVIYPGWEYLRNLANIFYIVSLIFIALATLFRLENYNYKHLLVSLIISALLVNFSLVIAQAILGFADTIQNSFLPNNVQVIRNLGFKLMVEPFSYLQKAWSSTNYGGIAAIVQSLFLLCVALGAFFVFGAILVLLMIRVVMLWVLLMLSPIPYIANILPFTHSATSKWWTTFLQYAFFAPIMAFFLRMTNLIVENNPRVLSVLTQPGSLPDTTVFTQNAELSQITDIALRFGSNFLLLIFLYVGLTVANSFGIIGGAAVEKFGKSAMSYPFFATGRAAGKLGKYSAKKAKYGYDRAAMSLFGKKNTPLSRAAFTLMRPGLFLDQMKNERKKNEHVIEDQSQAAALRNLRKTPFFKRRGEDPLALVNEHLGEKFLGEEYGIYTGFEKIEWGRFKELYEDAQGSGAAAERARLMLPAQLNRIAKGHHMNYVMSQFGKIAPELGLPPEGLGYTKNNLIGFLNYIQKKGIMTESDNEDFQKKLGNIGYAGGDIVATELTASDENGNAILIETELNKNKKQFEVVGAELYEELNAYAESKGLTKAQVAELEEGQGIHFAGLQTYLSGKNITFDAKKYKNAKLYESGVFEAQENLSKDDGIYKQWHESIFTYDKQGKVILNDAGERIYTSLDANSLFLLQRGNYTKKVKEWYKGFLKDPNHLRSEVERAMKRKARADGVDYTQADIDEQVKKAEYYTYLGALASLAGMQPKDIEKEYLTYNGDSVDFTDPKHQAFIGQKLQDLKDRIKKEIK